MAKKIKDIKVEEPSVKCELDDVVKIIKSIAERLAEIEELLKDIEYNTHDTTGFRGGRRDK